MAPTFLDLGIGEDDVITAALFPVNLGIPLGTVVWPCDVRTTVHHHDGDGSHTYEK
jgi:hypothetical protein